AEENSARDMGQVMEAFRRLRLASSGGCVLGVHHTGHRPDRPRGSSVIEPATDHLIKLKKTGPGRMEMTVVRHRDAETTGSWKLKLEVQTTGWPAAIRDEDCVQPEGNSDVGFLDAVEHAVT